MLPQNLTTHTFDMNEYFSGQCFIIGGRDFEKEERDAKIDKETFEDFENTSQGRKALRDIKDILKALRKS